MSKTSLASLLNKTPAKTAPAKGTKPVGSINIKLAGITVFSRSVWKESTSETPFLNELNDLANGSPEDAIKAITMLLSKMEVEVNTRKSSDLTLEELMA